MSSWPCLPLVALALLGTVPGAAVAQEHAATGTASTVVGTVFDHETGEPLTAVSVSLGRGPEGTEDAQMRDTDEHGNFAFADVEPGKYVIRASLLGRQTLTDTLTVAPDADVRVVLKLPVRPIDLQPILVTTRRVTYDWMKGFEERRLSHDGMFITRDEIEQRKPIVVTDLLRTVPGVSFNHVRRGGYLMSFADGCHPLIWVDGHRTFDSSWNGTGYDIDRLLRVQDVEGIEIYTHVGEVPLQFGPTECGAVVIWTRPPSAGPFPKVRWRAVFFGLALMAVGILLVR